MFELRSRKSKILMQLLLLLMTIPYVLPLVQMVLGSLGGRGLYNYKAVWDTGVVPTYFRHNRLRRHPAGLLFQHDRRLRLCQAVHP